MSAMLVDKACGGITSPSAQAMQGQVLGFEPRTGLQEFLPPGLVQSPLAMKGKASKDPTIPSLQESLNGPHADEFWKAMDAEISNLESKNTWKVMDQSAMPAGTKAVPGTWAQHIKRLPDGGHNKFKSRWCCRGDLQDYDGISYRPLVGWPTVGAGLLPAAAHDWKSRQVDFTLAFFQRPQPADNPLSMELPQYYRPAGYEGQDIVLQLNKSIYGQVDSPKLVFEHISKGMLQLGFLPSTMDPCIFIHSKLKLMVLNYCDEQIWLSPDNELIKEHVNKLKDLHLALGTQRLHCVPGAGKVCKETDVQMVIGATILPPISFPQKAMTLPLLVARMVQMIQERTGQETFGGEPTATIPIGLDLVTKQ
jgi:Reverse transcriptase (RNA-dependent DNA polymerase)